jgi:hypothetical protein
LILAYTSRSGLAFSSVPASFSKYFTCGSFSRTFIGSTGLVFSIETSIGFVSAGFEGINSELGLNSRKVVAAEKSIFLWLLS